MFGRKKKSTAAGSSKDPSRSTVWGRESREPGGGRDCVYVANVTGRCA
jgi:hypothetical protein